MPLTIRCLARRFPYGILYTIEADYILTAAGSRAIGATDFPSEAPDLDADSERVQSGC